MWILTRDEWIFAAVVQHPEAERSAERRHLHRPAGFRVHRSGWTGQNQQQLVSLLLWLSSWRAWGPSFWQDNELLGSMLSWFAFVGQLFPILFWSSLLVSCFVPVPLFLCVQLCPISQSPSYVSSCPPHSWSVCLLCHESSPVQSCIFVSFVYLPLIPTLPLFI